VTTVKKENQFINGGLSGILEFLHTYALFLVFIFFTTSVSAQLSAESAIVLGDIENANEIRGTSIVKNTGTTKLYLLRADADYGVKIQTSKKTLLPGDTALLSIWFVPEKSGKFNKKISLVHSQNAKPENIYLSGNLIKFATDPKTACFYFGEKNTNTVPSLTAIPFPTLTTAVSQSQTQTIIPTPTVNAPAPLPASVEPKTVAPLYVGKLPETDYKPNNIVFLVDVSSSMRDSLKLPLMKIALHNLINEIREVDRITFITYADTIKVLVEGGSLAQKETLHKQVDALKAKGMTKGRKAILFSQQLAQKHFIAEGNNQIIIATDGEFKFEKEDQKLWNKGQGTQPIVISTVAFGGEPAAIKTLKSLAKKGNGSFIQVRNKEESKTKLLTEIQQRSKIDNR
jgi:Mg-chelatase subunit ChlD